MWQLEYLCRLWGLQDAYSVRGFIMWCNVCVSVFQGLHTAGSPGQMKEWDGAVWRGGFPLLLCTLSPTCSARGNHFSILHRLDFLSNVLAFSLVCLCLSHSTSPCDSHFYLFRGLFPSLCCVSFFSPAQYFCGSCFTEKPQGTHLSLVAHTINTHWTIQLQLSQSQRLPSSSSS